MPKRSGASSPRARLLISIREMILRGEFDSRGKIEEVELSRLLGASRPMLRWALENLGQEGLVEETRPGEYHARVITEQDVADAMDARGALESLAAGMAAHKVRHPSQLEKARRINAELTAAMASVGETNPATAEEMARFGELNLAFHNALVALANSPMLRLSLERVQSIAFASPAAVIIPGEPGWFRQAIKDHDDILDAIQAGDVRRAESLVRQHARFALRGVKSALERPGTVAMRKSASPGHSAVSKRSGAAKKAPGLIESELPGPTAGLVLDAAAAAFCEKGFNATTTREIATRLNIRQASLYYHISGKEDLLYRISRLTLESIENKVRRALNVPQNPRDRLRALIQSHLEGLFESPKRSLAAIAEFRSLSRSHRRELDAAQKKYSELLDEELRLAVKQKIVRSDIPVPVIRLALLNYLNWTPRWYQITGSLPVAALGSIYERVFFDGIATSGQARGSAPESPSLRRPRSIPAHSGTLGKFVRTAAEMFSRQGYASTTTRSLSALIGMERATLYYHVKSKEDLLYLICKSSVESVQKDVSRAIESIDCPLQQIRALIRAHCLSLLRDQTQHATSLAEVRALSPSRLAEIVNMRKAYQAGIRRTFEAGQISGVFRGDVEARFLASMLRGLLDRTVEWYQKRGVCTHADLAGYFSDIFLFGVQAPSPAC
jgi:TetR/AcrR family transcriptional regulator, cholesterol catabolism regulator